MARCPICKEEQIGYDWTKTKTGKNWLQNKNGEWHDCPKSTGKYENKNRKWISLKPYDFIFCNLCGCWFIDEEVHIKYPDLHYIEMSKHIYMYHPSGEILDDIDFKVLSDENKEKIRINWSQPKRTTPYVLEGKMVH